ncbi:MAG: CocE/NonD family hydrolase, partial [Holophagae bacterium]|nr:CocE/NonD family hydrolase [Holophagae bacterium]
MTCKAHIFIPCIFHLVAIVLLLIPIPVIAGTSGSKDVQLQYTSIEIPTRDGKVLAADMYYSDSSPVTKPVVLIQTPYNKDYYRLSIIPGPAGGKMFPISEHYNYVTMDWRGFFGSSDAAVTGYDRGLDGYDAVEWIAGQNWCDGNVGTWGSSALGYIQYLTARYQPPHLRCCTPQVKSIKMQYEGYYYGGDYRKEHVESMESLGLGSTSLILSHPMKDSLWDSVEASSDVTPYIQVPCLLVTGWFDHFPDLVLDSFKDLRDYSGVDVRSLHKLIVGPWTHSGVNDTTQGIMEFPDADNLYPIEIQFWDHYLRDQDNGWDNRPVVSYYQMGENAWHFANSWADIERTATTCYLNAEKTLTTEKPAIASGTNTFDYNPDDPTPALGGSRFSPFDDDVLVGPQDLSVEIEPRDDVLVYTTGVLEQDVRVNGSISCHLYVSSDRIDTDFCVRLTDVTPTGESIILTQGIRRMRFRNGVRSQELMTPGVVYPVTIELSDLAMTFQTGHRIRIDISSACYPHFDLNPYNGGELYVDYDPLIAENNIHYGNSYLSRIEFETLANETTVYRIPHIAKSNWNSVIQVYNPTDSPISYTLSKWNEGHQELDKIPYTVQATSTQVLSYDELGNDGQASIQSENGNLIVKLSFQYKEAQSLSE